MVGTLLAVFLILAALALALIGCGVMVEMDKKNDNPGRALAALFLLVAILIGVFAGWLIP
jgi:hypothetical protein